MNDSALENHYPVINMLAVSSMFSLITLDAAEEITFCLQVAVMCVFNTPKLANVWVLFVLFAAKYWLKWDLLQLILHFTHFSMIGFCYLFVLFLMSNIYMFEGEIKMKTS